MASSDWDDTASAADRSCNEVNKTSEYRKIVKPLLEKRRRARMNNSLNELKAYIVDARKTEISDPSKLEKADILELTVRHLRDLRRQQRAVAVAMANGADASRFCAGFTECAQEVSGYLSSLPGLDSGLRTRLLTHLAVCVHQTDRMADRKMNSQPLHHHLPVPHPNSRQTVHDSSKHTFCFPSPYTLPTPTSQSSLRSLERNCRRSASPVWRPW